MRKITASGIFLTLLGAMFAGSMSSASAHTPSVSASCDGVVLSGTNYDGSKQNKWSVTINGATQSGTFGESFSQTFPVPQGGASSTWSGTVEAEDGSFKQSESGSVGPCGEIVVPPKPDDEVEKREIVDDPNCVDFTVTTQKQRRTIPYVYDEQSNTWKLGEPTAWETYDTSSRDATLEECPPPPKPEPIVTEKSAESYVCGDAFKRVHTETTSIDWALNEQTRVWYQLAPVVEQSTEKVAVDVVECDEPEPPTDDETPPALTLPNTGAPTHVMGMGSAALGMILVGAALWLIDRRKVRTDA